MSVALDVRRMHQVAAAKTAEGNAVTMVTTSMGRLIMDATGGQKRGLNALGRLACAAVAGAAVMAGSGQAPASAQGKDLSDKSVATLVAYAWVITPAKFTMPDGKVIEVDKKNKDAAMVPIEKAREIVRIGRLSANAQICGLPEAQGANYQTMMKREIAAKKWSDQQTLFISQLHLFTVMLMTGKVTIVDSAEGQKDVVVQDTKITPPTPTACSEAERKKVEEQIMAYMKADVAPAPAKQ